MSSNGINNKIRGLTWGGEEARENIMGIQILKEFLPKKEFLGNRRFRMCVKTGLSKRIMFIGLCLPFGHSLFADVINGVEYDLDTYSKTAKVTNVDETINSVVIPKTIICGDETYTVTEVSGGFSGKENLKSVTIEVEMTEIPRNFFNGCRNLSSLFLPSSITLVNEYAFSNCASLTSLEFLPESVDSIGDKAFEYCTGLTSIVYSKDIKWGYSVFNGCSGATSMTIEAFPEGSSTSFGGYGFTNLKTLRIEDSNEPLTIDALPDDAPLEEVYIGRDIKERSYYDFPTAPDFNGFPNQSVRSVVFGDEVTYVPANIFSGASALASVTFGSNIRVIGEAAFSGANLTNVTIPESVDSLMTSAFSGNTALAEINLPATLEYIGSGCFYGAAIQSITLPTNLTVVDGFSNCKSLESITIPDNVTEIAPRAFFSCKKLAKITLGKNIKKIGDGAFYECYKMYDVYYNGSISDWCGIQININGYPEDTNPLLVARNFYVTVDNAYLQVKDLVIPEDVTRIGDYAFYGCKAITSVHIPDNVTSVGEEAFSECTKLESIYVDADTIQRSAFLGYIAKTLTLGTNVKVIKEDAFYTKYATPYYVKYEGDIMQWLNLEVKYRALECRDFYIGGERLTNLTVEQFSTAAIRDNAFYGCSSLTTVDLPYSVKTVGSRAFAYCSNLTSVNAKGVNKTKIGDYAFSSCGNLETVDLSENVTRALDSDEDLLELGEGAFSRCSKLNKIVFPDNLASIGRYAFEFCSSLGEISLPDNVGYIGLGAFDNTLWYESFPDGIVYFGDMLYSYKGEMPENTVLAVKDGTRKINESALSGQYNMIGISIPASVTQIEAYAFSGSGLKSIQLPTSIETIPVGLLKDCYYLKDIQIPTNVNYISHDAFAGCDSLENIRIEDSETTLVWEGWYLAYSSFWGINSPTYPEYFGFSSSCPKHLYLGRDMQSEELVYDRGDGEYGYRINVTDLFNTDSLVTLTIGKHISQLELNPIVCHYDWENGTEYTCLKSITCLGTEPPTFPTDEYSGYIMDPFNELIKQNVPLTVLHEAVDAYRAADVWKDFYNIQGTTSLKEMIKPQTGYTEGVHYDIQGRLITPDVSGLHIIRNADGTTRKLWVR